MADVGGSYGDENRLPLNGRSQSFDRDALQEEVNWILCRIINF